MKEGAGLVAESGKENEDSVAFKLGQQGKKSNQIFCKTLLEIFSLVELYQDAEIVAEGRVVHLPPCSVHNHLLTSSEVNVEVSKVHKPTVTPHTDMTLKRVHSQQGT